MSTIRSTLRDLVMEAVTSPEVGIAAALAPAVWASTAVPRVFDGMRGFIAGRNRGRCPYLEVWVEPQRFPHTTADGGTVTSTVRIRGHAASRDATDLLDALLVAAVLAVRNGIPGGYAVQGEDVFSPAEPGPMGWRQDAVLTVEQSYDRTNLGSED